VAVVAALGGVVAVVDVEEDRVVGHSGVDDDDTREVVAHFTETWWELLNALLPVLGDATDLSWTPGRWWACAGGDHVAVGRAGRAVVVTRDAAPPFLTAVAADGALGDVQVW
jgi:roadblock/LC7 domain-containing protein